MPLKEVRETNEEVDMKFEYRKKSLIYPKEAHFFPPLFLLEFISQHQVKKEDYREMENKGGWNFSVSFLKLEC
jgi:hypothetical protein